MPFDPKKLDRFLARKKAAGGSRIGGKGSVRRKRKAIRKNATHDDKRLKNTLNKLNVRDIPAIEEVNLFKEDGNVIHFASPKVQASIAANTYVVSGNAETKKLQDLLPGILNQLGPDDLDDLKNIYDEYVDKDKIAEDDSDDDVPELVENFEDVSNKPVQNKSNKKDDSSSSDDEGDTSGEGDSSSDSDEGDEGDSSSSDDEGDEGDSSDDEGDDADDSVPPLVQN